MRLPAGTEGLWALAVEHSPVGMTLVSPDGVLLSANRALCAMLDRTEDDLVGSDFKQLTHPDDLARHLALYDATVAGERTSYRITKRCVRSDGSVLWGDLSVAMVTDPDGPHCLIGQILDVTHARVQQQRLAEAVDLLDKQRRRSRAILDSADVALVLIDREGRYQDGNRRYHEFVTIALPGGDHQLPAHLGATYDADGTSVIDPDDVPTARAARGEEFDDVIVWIGADPETRRALSVSARSVTAADGSFAGAALSCSDITELMRAVQAREDFLATVSHELRTPLTSIIGYTELLLDLGESQVGPAARRMLAIVERNANRELRLVNDLLDLAFLDDREHMDAEPVDLVEVVRAAVDGARVGARGRGLELSSTLAAGVAPDGARALLVTGDEQRLGQVLDNLLSNAVKFTAPGGRVLVDCAPREGDLALSVSDTGTGMEAVEVPRIFDRLYRSPRAVRDQVPGAGLGLSIVDSIVRAHGGRIEVDSEPGVGTTVSVLLPARVEPVA